MPVSSLLSIFLLVPKCQVISVTDQSVSDKRLQAVLTVSLSCGHCKEGLECRWNSHKLPISSEKYPEQSLCVVPKAEGTTPCAMTLHLFLWQHSEVCKWILWKTRAQGKQDGSAWH